MREGDDGFSVDLLEEKLGRGGVESEVGEQPQAANDGTYEEDGLVTWEVFVFPREIRSHGEPVNHLRNWRVHRRTCRPPSSLGKTSVCPGVGRWQGELEPRPKEARKSEGPI